MEYASKAVGTAGLTTGIIGTALGALGGGMSLLGSNVAAQNNTSSDDHYVTRYDIQMLKELMAKDSEIALLKSEQNTEVKIADVYERIMTRVNADQRAQAEWNASQSVINAQISGAIATNTASIASLQNCCDKITKIVIPNTSICPGWGDVKITPAQ